MREKGPAAKPNAATATAIHAIEWAAAVALAAPSHVGWQALACGVIGAVSIARVRRMCRAADRTPATVAHVAMARTGQEAVPHAPTPPSAPQVRESITVAPSHAGAVLLAEDDRDNQTLVSKHLRSLGFTVTIAGNGRAAVDLATAAARSGEPFDVIVMDMQMPQMDGYTAARELRKVGYPGTIVALTANAVRGDREKCLDAGCDEYLSKPVDRPKLVATIRRGVDSARSAMENADTTCGKLSIASSTEPLVSELADDPDIADILGEFVRLLGVRASALRDALARNDLEMLKRVAHQLKGAAGGYGFPSITEQAASVEDAMANAGDGSQLRRAVESLCSLCARAAFPRGPARHPIG